MHFIEGEKLLKSYSGFGRQNPSICSLVLWSSSEQEKLKNRYNDFILIFNTAVKELSAMISLGKYYLLSRHLVSKIGTWPKGPHDRPRLPDGAENSLGTVGTVGKVGMTWDISHHEIVRSVNETMSQLTKKLRRSRSNCSNYKRVPTWRFVWKIQTFCTFNSNSVCQCK